MQLTLYAATLKPKSNTNLRRRFSKQNLAENETNSTVTSSILNSCLNGSTSKSRSSEASNLQTEDCGKATLPNEIEILKKEI